MSIDTVAVDANRLTAFLQGYLGKRANVPDDMILFAVDAAINAGSIYDVAVVRHEHGRRVLKQAAVELRCCAGERFDEHGPHDVRGAAIWDSAAHIDPDEGQWSPPP